MSIYVLINIVLKFKTQNHCNCKKKNEQKYDLEALEDLRQCSQVFSDKTLKEQLGHR